MCGPTISILKARCTNKGHEYLYPLGGREWEIEGVSGFVIVVRWRRVVYVAYASGDGT